MNRKTNKYISTFLLLLVFAFAKAQDAFHNFGTVQIHDQGQIGFHIDLVNDGDFDENSGLAGFYNTTGALFILGNNEPIFQDMEIDVQQDLNLEVSVGVRDFLNFVTGEIETPREDLNITLNYLGNSLFLGESDNAHIDGYTTNNSGLDFLFPTGNDERLRPIMVLPQSGTGREYRTAYFFENPNIPSTLSGSFNTESFGNSLSIISNIEYWDFDGTEPANLTLTWDEFSDISALADDLSSLRVVGFSRALQRWVDLGNTSFSGSFISGEITSELIDPDLFEAFTFGSILKAGGDIIVYTIISPNGDGLNDTLVIEGLETSPDNELFIYNRWGVEVFSMNNYDNSFDGRSNGRLTIDGDAQLPVGTYYYVLKLRDRPDQAGAFYINR